MQLRTPTLLLASALALLASVAHAEGEGDWRISSDTLVYTDTDNVLVVTPQVAVAHPLDASGGAASARVVVDVVSAASVDVVSQATKRFSEVRTEVDLGVSKAFGKLVPSLSYRHSEEADYDSNGFGAGLLRQLGSSDTTLSVNYDIAFDAIGYTGTAHSAFSESLRTQNVNASLTQVLGPRTLLRGIYTLTHQAGYMAKPYRFVPLFDSAGLDAAKAAGVSIDLSNFDQYRLSERPAERVPDIRVGHAFGVRALRYLESLPGSLHLDAQLFLDNWGMVAATLEPGLSWKLSDRTLLSGYLRYYQQNGAIFWRKQYVVRAGDLVPRWRTGDRDLSPYYTVTGGARFETRRGHLTGYVDASVMDTVYSDYMFLTSRMALVSQLGMRLEL